MKRHGLGLCEFAGMFSNLFHGFRKGFSGGSQKIIGVYSGSRLATGAARSAAEGSSLGALAPMPAGSRGSAYF